MAEIAEVPDDPARRLSAPVPLTSAHDLSGFDCGEPVLNDWLGGSARLGLPPTEFLFKPGQGFG
jgi:hypothetical protein